MGGGKIFTKRKRFLHSSLLSRKEDVFGGESSFQGRKTWKKFFRPTSWLHFLRNEGDPETPPFFHRGRVKKKEKKRRRRKKIHPQREKFFLYIFPCHLSALFEKAKGRETSQGGTSPIHLEFPLYTVGSNS